MYLAEEDVDEGVTHAGVTNKGELYKAIENDSITSTLPFNRESGFQWRQHHRFRHSRLRRAVDV